MDAPPGSLPPAVGAGVRSSAYIYLHGAPRCVYRDVLVVTSWWALPATLFAMPTIQPG